MQQLGKSLEAHKEYAQLLTAAAASELQQQRRAYAVQHKLSTQSGKAAADVPAVTTSNDAATMNCAHHSAPVSAWEMQLRALSENCSNVPFRQRTFYGVQVGRAALVKSQARILLMDAQGFPAILQFAAPSMKGNAKAKVQMLVCCQRLTVL